MDSAIIMSHITWGKHTTEIKDSNNARLDYPSQTALASKFEQLLEWASDLSKSPQNERNIGHSSVILLPVVIFM